MQSSPHAPWALRGGFPRAVLFLHGIMGSPAQFHALGKVLHAAGWDCVAALLPGHGGSQGDFAGARSAEWRQGAEQAIAEACAAYSHVVVFAHSMGCLLALEAAARGTALDGLVLLSPALAPRVTPQQVGYSLRILFSKPANDDDILAAYRQANSIQSGPLWGYLRWAAPMLSLTRLSRTTRSCLRDVRCPVLVLQASYDESVGSSGVRRLARALPEARVVWLPSSGHIYFAPADAQKIGEETLGFLADIDSQGATNPSSSG